MCFEDTPDRGRCAIAFALALDGVLDLEVAPVEIEPLGEVRGERLHAEAPVAWWPAAIRWIPSSRAVTALGPARR